MLEEKSMKRVKLTGLHKKTGTWTRLESVNYPLQQADEAEEEYYRLLDEIAVSMRGGKKAPKCLEFGNVVVRMDDFSALNVVLEPIY